MILVQKCRTITNVYCACHTPNIVYVPLPVFINPTVLIHSANYRLKGILLEDYFVIELERVYTCFLSVLAFLYLVAASS